MPWRSHRQTGDEHLFGQLTGAGRVELALQEQPHVGRLDLELVGDAARASPARTESFDGQRCSLKQDARAIFRSALIGKNSRRVAAVSGQPGPAGQAQSSVWGHFAGQVRGVFSQQLHLRLAPDPLPGSGQNGPTACSHGRSHQLRPHGRLVRRAAYRPHPHVTLCRPRPMKSKLASGVPGLGVATSVMRPNTCATLSRSLGLGGVSPSATVTVGSLP